MSVALFIRHGKASAFASSTDYDELSPPGVEQSEKLGEWLAQRGLSVDAVFVGPRKRHAQTLASVVRVLSARGVALPEATHLAELDEHDGMSLLLKMLPELATKDLALGAIVQGHSERRPPFARRSPSRRLQARDAPMGPRRGGP